MIFTIKNVLKEYPKYEFYTWLPLITWITVALVPLFICVTLDVLMVMDMQLPWDSSREKCHPILSGLFFYMGLLAMYYHLRDKKPREAVLRASMIVAGMLFTMLYLIDIIFLSFWFVTMDSEMTAGLLILPFIYVPLSWFYLRYFFRDLKLRIPEKIQDWGQEEFLHV